MDTVSVPLLQTKFYVPPPRPNLVSRPRLMARLDQALRLRHRLTIITARAGSGKTTLVSEWLHQQERPSTWLSLEPNDDDLPRFFSYLVMALRQLAIATRFTRLTDLAMPELPPAEAFVTGLINDIATASTPFILVLDDYHFIQNPWVHRAIAFLIDHQPPEMHLILTTRVDPPLPLARLRARGQLTELRDQDLRFTAGEVLAFLNDAMELDLPAEAAATIDLRTEGWIAGLHMAAISAQAHRQQGDLAAFVEAFGGSNRYILDYLLDEVLDRQPPAMQDFLAETSILERMCADLCDALRPGTPLGTASQAILEDLERANLFVISLDDERRWYRYHHLFAGLLQSILKQRRSEQQIRELHRRAGRWYQGQGLLGEAMIHLMAARDYERAAEIIEGNIARLLHMFSPGREPLLLSWIEQLPDEIKRARPWIDVYRASILALNLQLDSVEPILEDVEQRVVTGSPRASEITGYVAAVRAYCANLRGNAAQALSMAALAQEHLHAGENLAAQGMAAYALADTLLAGDDLKGARHELLDVLRAGEKAGQLMMIVLALCDLAAVEKARGRLSQAEELYRQAYRKMIELDGLESRVRCSYEFGLADLLREQNRLDEAYEHVRIGMAYRRRLGGYLLIGELAAMRVQQARGDLEGAMKALRDAEQAVETLPFQMALMVEFKTARVALWLAAGDIETARRWAEMCGGSELEQIARARVLLAQGQAADARRLLVRQQELAQAGERAGRSIEILSLLALALEAQNMSRAADQALSRALSLARAEGYRRVFLDVGRPLCHLLERQVALEDVTEGAAAADYARRLLDAFQPGPRSGVPGCAPTGAMAPSEPLTGRETDVLRLLAEGFTNKEIAGRLTVAPSTVKQHLKSIFAKLDAHSRTQAVARGRELGLI